MTSPPPPAIMAEKEKSLELQRPCSSTEGPGGGARREEQMKSPQPQLEVVVDIDQTVLLNSINDRLNVRHRDSRRLQPCTIYRVRESIRNENPQAYHPQLVAIGPYHRGDTLLRPMEQVKNQFFRDLITRDESNTVNKYIKALSDPLFVAKANQCYSEPVVLSEEGNAFVEMMMFDGCFIIEFLVKSVLNEDMGELDFVTWNHSTIENDLLLLENQIPFSVLQVLYDNSVIPGFRGKFEPPPTLAELFLSYTSRETDDSKPIPEVIHHLLHLSYSSLAPAERRTIASKFGTFRSVTHNVWNKIRDFISPPFLWLLLVLLTCRRPPLYKRSMNLTKTMLNATELHDSGIKFEIKEKSGMLDVTFRIRDGVMEMPRLLFGALTASQFMNLIAFEQCCPYARNYFTAYVLLMQDLIKDVKDVAVLERSGVLERKIGSGEEEVAKLFNTVGKGAFLSVKKHYLVGLFKDVRVHYATERHILRMTIHKWKATLVQNYFSSPWSTCSLIAAFVLLLLTFCQTFFAAFAYFRPAPLA